MVELDNFYEINAIEGIRKSFHSIFTHWNPDTVSFYRSSKDIDKFYPTASLHCFSTYENFKHIDNINDDGLSDIKESFNSFSKFIKKYDFQSLIDNSTNSYSDGGGDRIYILLERFINCLFVFKNKEIVEYLRAGKKEIKPYLDNFKNIIEVSQPGSSPLLILKISQIIVKLNSIDEHFINELIENDIKETIKVLITLSKSHIDYHMARYQVAEETSFDTVSLATAIFCRTLLDPDWKNSSFFNKCLEVVMQNQYKNGCWPSGISVSFSENADVLQLPSIEIACYIIESAIDKNILINHSPEIENRLRILLPGFRIFSKFLELTFQEFYSHSKSFTGWSSDRLGIKNFTEAWITAMINRFYFLYWIAEKANLRCKALTKLGCQEFKAKSLTKQQSEDFWKHEVFEIDDQIKPIDTIYKFISNILEQKHKDFYLCYPNKDLVSIILFGPPGTGKNTIVEKMAQTLDWPLIEIAPGHFIKNGLELIESTSNELFELLSKINHVVVLFDECDELFRDRSSDGSVSRSILSFATASMLPKLQKLHDRRNLIFILNTNYFHKMDDAITRKGRFDEIILIDRPDNVSRKAIIEYFDIEKKITNIEDSVKQTEGLLIKDIINFCKNGKINEQSYKEYVEWTDKTGRKELEKYSYNKENNIIKTRWSKLKKNECRIRIS